jgi:NADPH:quinone reductase-like Zn-dependent oxidoreductase
MQAAVFYTYGKPNVLSIQDVPKPTPNENEVLVKIHFSTVNAADWRIRNANPFLVRLMMGLFTPKVHILGVAFSGIVEAIGQRVTEFQVGDRVCGLNDTGKNPFGCHAEFVVVAQTSSIVKVPMTVSLEDAAAVLFGGHTALYFLTKLTSIQSGQTVLIIGASGSVGTSAVQLAKHYGAKVTGVCSGKNMELVVKLGADSAIDYTTKPLENLTQSYDVVYDTVGKTDYKKLMHLVKTGGSLLLGAGMVKEMLFAKSVGKKYGVAVHVGTAEAKKEDIEKLLVWVQDGALKPVISQTFDFEHIVDAHRVAESWRKVGNVLLKIR